MTWEFWGDYRVGVLLDPYPEHGVLQPEGSYIHRSWSQLMSMNQLLLVRHNEMCVFAGFFQLMHMNCHTCAL